jgi:hypothetical protein
VISLKYYEKYAEEEIKRANENPVFRNGEGQLSANLSTFSINNHSKNIEGTMNNRR